jgi:hypothetical protein
MRSHVFEFPFLFREFIGEAWLKWLKDEGIHFDIRVKKDAQVPNSRGEIGFCRKSR